MTVSVSSAGLMCERAGVAVTHLWFFTGGVCPRCVHSLQSSSVVGRTGRRQLLLPETEPAGRHEAQKDADQVEGDGRQVRRI